VGDYYPAFSPDGHSLAFVRIFNQRNPADLYVQPLQAGTARRMTFESKEITGLTWASRDRLVFPSDRSGNFQLWSVPSRGGSPELVPGSGQDASQPTASADGRTLVYAERFRNTDIWRVHLGTGPPEGPAKLITSSTENYSGQYSPDGRHIVFVSDRSGVPALWICGADGSHPVLLFTGDGASVGTPRWSPDGRQIVFDTVKRGRAVVEVIQAEGGTPRLITSGNFDYMMPSWSQDGQWIYYASSVGSKTTQLWKQPVAGGAPVQVTHEGGGEAHESLDGKTLYYLKPQLGIWQMPVSGGAETHVPGLEHVYTGRHLAVSRTGLYFLASEDPPWTVHFYDFATRRISAVATIQRTPTFETPSLSVSPDGHWLIYSQLDQAGEDLMALRNVQY
jgi:Tol biopolymer transport system component